MTLKRFAGGLLLAPVAALVLAGAPGPAVADPPSTPPGHAKKAGGGGLPPGLAKKHGNGDFCPPGLAKKNEHCMPPGQYKKLHRGDRIPDFRAFAPFPYREYGLPDPGPNRRYIRRGDEAYLISEGTNRILEAIRLFEAAAE